MTKTLRLQTGLSSDASNSPTNIGGSNTGSDWVPFYVEEEKEQKVYDAEVIVPVEPMRV